MQYYKYVIDKSNMNTKIDFYYTNKDLSLKLASINGRHDSREHILKYVREMVFSSINDVVRAG